MLIFDLLTHDGFLTGYFLVVLYITKKSTPISNISKIVSILRVCDCNICWLYIFITHHDFSFITPNFKKGSLFHQGTAETNFEKYNIPLFRSLPTFC
jgi:hypothetical protein